jgi:hypothetical protein
MGCRLTATKLGRVLDVIKHQGCSMKKVDDSFDGSNFGWRHSEPGVERIDRYITDPLGR